MKVCGSVVSCHLRSCHAISCEEQSRAGKWESRNRNASQWRIKSYDIIIGMVYLSFFPVHEVGEEDGHAVRKHAQLSTYQVREVRRREGGRGERGKERRVGIRMTNVIH